MRAPVGALLAVGLVVVWLLVDPRTPDLAAQAYRVGLYERSGFALFDEHWYSGHGLPGYSLLFAPLASLLGMRVLAALSALASSALFERVVLRSYGDDRRVRVGACLFAVAAVGDIWSGRLTFALGVAFALACVCALSYRQRALAALAAAASAAASPVAGLLLALAGCTYGLVLLASRRESAVAVARYEGAGAPSSLLLSPVLLTLVAPVAFVLVPLELLFAEGGSEPYPTTSFAATTLVVVCFLWALPRGRELRLRLPRFGAIVYLLACVLSLVFATPMGSNVERYGVLLAGPLLLCALAASGDDGEAGAARGSGAADVARGSGEAARPRISTSRVIAACALLAWAVWVVWGPVRETAAVSGAGAGATEASYYAPVVRFFASLGGGHAGGRAGVDRPIRVEVPLTRSHWEAAFLAPTVSLARGWEKQLDERYDSTLLGRGLTPASYHRWLSAQAVDYVALPDAPPDPSSARESALIRRGLPYLRPVFASRHWHIYAVLDPTPLLEGPGALSALGHDSFTLSARAPGTLLVRVHYSRYFMLSAGAGCVTSAPGGWTYVRARAPGRIVVAARFSLARALGFGGSCAASPAAAR